ncbi:Non-specific serine/threonine protein kinase protein [Dioscorea alata]|nr:Non-specific serine/threonine protein kinase protein [Dioscorea alata]KAH7691781.1 Non-specific serine/threonine protein kinase protein [Dioscorea alata]
MTRLASLKLLLLALHCCYLLVPSQSSLNNEVSALIAFKRAIFEDPLRVLSDWNVIDGNPCNWTGIYCSRTLNRVITLNLSSSSLKGFLTPEVGLLNFLQQLILNDNLLLGTIPRQIGLLKRLSLLDLSVNRLSGPIPPEIGNLTNAVKIDLHSNGLTGNVPPELGNLLSLTELRLDRNRLDGSFPGSNSLSSSSSPDGMSASKGHNTGLCRLPRLRNADFSYNFLVGLIPACLKYLPRTSFEGNCLQDKYAILQRSTEKCGALTKSKGAIEEAYKHSSEQPDHRKQSQPEWLVILEIITGSLMFVFCISALATALKLCKPKSSQTLPWKRSSNCENQLKSSVDGEVLKNIARIYRQELEVACEDFSNIIGTYPDSIIYKGTMVGGQEIAVVSLCISKDQWTSYLEFYFQNKVAALARLNHGNISKLLGFCKEDDPFTRMLIFNYASNGTLAEHLHYGEECRLSWLRRMKIAIGIARGLKYLHTELQPPFTICDLNSNSVYLTEDFSPK